MFTTQDFFKENRAETEIKNREFYVKMVFIMYDISRDCVSQQDFKFYTENYAKFTMLDSIMPMSMLEIKNSVLYRNKSK